MTELQQKSQQSELRTNLKLGLVALACTLGLIIAALWLDMLLLATALILGLVVGAAFLAILWRAPGTLLIIYIIALPAYILTLAALFKFSSSTTLVAMIRPWKEIAALLLLIFIGIGVLQRLKITGRLHKLDLLVLAFLCLNLLYLFVPWGPDFTIRLYGLRANGFFVLIYGLGRLVPISVRLQKWIFGLLIGVGVLAALVAIFEIALPPAWPNELGYANYIREFFGQEPTGHYGLSWTFETSTGLRRRSAFFANPLELASSTLITGVAALYWMFSFKPRTWGRLIAAASWGLIALSLVLTVSRASTLAFGVQTVVAAIWLRKTRFALAFVLLGLAGLLAIIVLLDPRLLAFVIESITFQNPSMQGHLSDWSIGLQTMLTDPLGIGLGTSGQTGDRFGDSTSGESQFFILGVQLGLLGLLLYILILWTTIRYSLKAYRRTSGYTKALCFVAAAAKFGLLFPSFSAHTENYVFAMFITWWLVGFAIQQLGRQTETAVSPPPSPQPKELSIAHRH